MGKFILFFIYYILLKMTPCFHFNFRIALYNLFMHPSLTNQNRDILMSIYNKTASLGHFAVLAFFEVLYCLEKGFMAI